MNTKRAGQTETEEIFHVQVTRELALAANRLGGMKKVLAGTLNLDVNQLHIQCVMPSQYSPDKEPFSMQIPRALLRRLQREAKAAGMTVPAFITAKLTQATVNTTLTSQDYEAIAKATKEAERTGKRRSTRFDDPA